MYTKYNAVRYAANADDDRLIGSVSWKKHSYEVNKTS
jgi:hypothetical protein